MRSMIHGPILVAALLACAPAVSDAIPASLVLVTSRPHANAPYRFFGGRTVTLPLLVRAPEPGGLTIRAELVQLTSRLAVPAGVEIDVPLSGRPTAGDGVELDVAVALPAVDRETDFELRFRSSRPGDRASQAAGQIPLRVYPTGLLSPVRDWARSHPIRVEDDGGALIAFFTQQGIGVADKPGPRTISVYAGPRALQKQSRVPLRDGETVILLAERETDTPHFVIDRTGRGTTVRVEMRLLDRLAVDPLAQKTLLAMFQHLIDGAEER
jgi:hypothetical protein